MFIVWGKRVSRKKVGYVADFCPMCREARTFLLREVRSYSHIYYIPTSTSTLHGHERVCQGCELALSGAPKQYVAVPKKPAHVREILARSFPSFDEVYGERLKIEQTLRVAPDSLPTPIRRALIQQPFLVLSPVVEAKYRQTSVDGIGLASLIGGIALMMLPVIVADSLPVTYRDPFIIAGVVAGLCLLVGGLATNSRRYARGKLAPKLASTLRPLRPSEAEIATVLGELKQKGHKIGRILKPVHVTAALAK
jgi:hypothetical protein